MEIHTQKTVDTKISKLNKLLNDITDSNKHQEILNSDDALGNESW
ncbi:MAG: hypothetical protein ACRYE8_03885 [Janthinobacterium lividum]